MCGDFQEGGGRAWEGFSFHKIQKERAQHQLRGPIAYPAMGSAVLIVGGPLQVLRCGQSKPTRVAVLSSPQVAGSFGHCHSSCIVWMLPETAT